MVIEQLRSAFDFISASRQPPANLVHERLDGLSFCLFYFFYFLGRLLLTSHHTSHGSCLAWGSSLGVLF
jgi:hypothetical protein